MSADQIALGWILSKFYVEKMSYLAVMRSSGGGGRGGSGIWKRVEYSSASTAPLGMLGRPNIPR